MGCGASKGVEVAHTSRQVQLRSPRELDMSDATQYRPSVERSPAVTVTNTSRSMTTPGSAGGKSNIAVSIDSSYSDDRSGFTGDSRSVSVSPVPKLAFDSPGYVLSRSQYNMTAAIKSSLDSHHDSRVIRVFISSTFIDFFDERENLLKHTFPRLKPICEERGLSLSWVDMRWGVTSEMGDSGLTILTCLSEIDHSRPYFIGMLGERYGWHRPMWGEGRVCL
eukprot:GFYU01020579.1.p1 GENE.GFYU01020579.1~~GFYU01020579.1.p1  ORF type:complete len:222 (-),score=29.19 GFYU01020579.1:2-667(-)